MPELVAPAGSKDSLKAAILGGADAVYLGGKRFGARRLAENFTPGELKAAVRIAHDNNVKVFATVNTLIKEKELSAVLSHVDFLVSIDIDAIIIQDRGLLQLISDNFSIPIHASTQMGIHSPECAAWAKANGISRAILARELTFSELKKLREDTDIELEIFVHGALCYSYSGQCLFSSLLGGRSGNRGMCAQPCRKMYKIGNMEGYMLSTADLCAIDNLPHLMKIGIDAFKIEGRMRSPVYVYLASRIYSNAIARIEKGEEEIITARERELLETVFNRGFTTGYLDKEQIMQRDFPDSRGLPLGTGTVMRGVLRIKSESIQKGDGITLYKDGKKIGGFEVGRIGKSSNGYILVPPFNLQDGDYFIYKTKDREFPKIQKMIESFPFKPERAEERLAKLDLPYRRREKSECELSFYISSLKSLQKILPYATRVYFEWNKQFNDAKRLCEDRGIEIVLMMPRISTAVPETHEESLMVCTLGQAHKYSDKKLYGHYSLNFFNSLTIPKLYQYTLSVELNRDEIRETAEHYFGRLEILAFGKIELMVTKDPTIPEGILVDERGKKFEVYRDNHGLTHILNSDDLILLDYLDEITEIGIDSIGIDLRRRDSELCELIGRAFYEKRVELKDEIKRRCKSITHGHYLRGVL
ncbi:MAG: peptidase U32 family protein [Methanomassiliicoccales archaeon]|nr:peptidase U32 family protein [Methanomassiliicoccales archaeon]